MMEPNEVDSILDRAVTFLRGGVQRPGVEQPLRVIETWGKRLAASEHEELIPIAENLAYLRVQLLAREFDPSAVGQLLITLGEQSNTHRGRCRRLTTIRHIPFLACYK